jgi:hypothetical protein
MDELNPKEIKTILDDLVEELMEELIKLQKKLYQEELNEQYEEAALTLQLINLTITQATQVYITFTNDKFEIIEKAFNDANIRFKNRIRNEQNT